MSDCHTYTAKCPPHDVFNSWHIAQNKATKKIEKSQHVHVNTLYVAEVLTKLKRYAKYGIHKFDYESVPYHTSHITHIHIRHATMRCVFDVHTNVCKQIITNTELLFYYLYSLNHKICCQLKYFFASFFISFLLLAIYSHLSGSFYLHSHGDLVKN